MDTELEAMAKVMEAIKDLDEDAKERVLSWVRKRFKLEIDQDEIDNNDNDKDKENDKGKLQFETFADLYNEVSPKSEAEKVLVAGYWHQEIKGEKEFVSLSLNKDLKNLGHGVKEISKKLVSLIKNKPALALQIKKRGSTRQAKKQYKLTQSGINQINQKLSNKK